MFLCAWRACRIDAGDRGDPADCRIWRGAGRTTAHDRDALTFPRDDQICLGPDEPVERKSRLRRAASRRDAAIFKHNENRSVRPGGDGKAGAIYPSLKGKTVLVTGGGSGIGEAIVRRYADQGGRSASRFREGAVGKARRRTQAAVSRCISNSSICATSLRHGRQSIAFVQHSGRSRFW